MSDKEKILEIYDGASPDWTFERLDATLKIPAGTTATALDKWFAAVKAKKIATLGDGDLAKALRQRVHVPVVLMAALNRLLKDPLVGETAPGELISAVLDVPAVVWTDISGLVSTMQHVSTQALAKPSKEPEWKGIAARLQRWLDAMEPPLGRLVINGAARDVRKGDRLTIGDVVLSAADGTVRIVSLAPGVTKNGAPVGKEVTLVIGDVVKTNGVELRFEA